MSKFNKFSFGGWGGGAPRTPPLCDVIEYFLFAEERELTQSFFYFTEQGSKEARAKKKAVVTEKAKKAVRCYFPPPPRSFLSKAGIKKQFSQN